MEVAKCFVNNDIDIVVGYLKAFDSRSGEQIAYHRTFVSDNVAQTIFTTNLSQASTFMKTKIVKYFGGVNTQMHYTMDLELWIKYLVKYGTSKIRLIDTHLANFRIHSLSKTGSEQPKFLIDKHKIFRSLLAQLNAPTLLLDFFGYLFPLPNYEQHWEIESPLDKNKLFIHFIDEYLFYLKMNWKVEYITILKCLIYRYYLLIK
jgi:hypothetical protein